jgi:hypothetical protein
MKNSEVRVAESNGRPVFCGLCLQECEPVWRHDETYAVGPWWCISSCCGEDLLSEKESEEARKTAQRSDLGQFSFDLAAELMRRWRP